MKTKFWALSDEQKAKVRKMRLKTKYHYNKCKFGMDATYFYNILNGEATNIHI